MRSVGSGHLFYKICLVFFALFACAFVPFFVHAQSTASPSSDGSIKAVVLNIVSDTLETDPGVVPKSYNEVVSARLLDGDGKGTSVQVSNYYTDGDGQILEPGETIYVSAPLPETTADGAAAQYQSIDHYRLPVVIAFVLIFLVCILWVGGRQGLRGLISLIAGIVLILFLFLPGVTHGYSPILLSVVVASFIATIGAYITHGFSRMTTSAVFGMLLTIVIAAILSQIAVHLGYLSGVADEGAYDLLTNPIPGASTIDFQALLLGGIVIGLLGVLYDAAIGQAVAVEELTRAAPEISRSEIYERALRIGREHIGALVNTLVLAYVGASLPLILTVYESVNAYGANYAMQPVANVEFVATEMIRTTVGAIGLILTIPITTWIATLMLVRRDGDANATHPR